MPIFLAAAEPGNQFQDILTRFGIEGGYLFWQLVSFAILAFVLYRFLLKPVLATMTERQSQIVAGLKYAEDMKARLAQAEQDSAAIVKQAQLEGAKLVEETRQAAKAFLEQQQADATARANDLIARARQAVELEHKNMLEQTRVEVARLVVATTRQVLARELSDAEKARYNEAAARELAER